MKKANVLLLLLSLVITTGCISNATPSEEKDPNPVSIEEGSSSSQGEGSQGGGSQGGGGESEPQKVSVKAHTLKDSNPPINVGGDGQQVSESTWNSFKNGSNSFFNKHYNYTYEAYSGGYLTTEKFTKNGYCVSTMYATQYYERKSGNTFYNYVDSKEGLLRQEVSGFDLTDKFTSRIVSEIYVHMFEFSDYVFEEDFYGTYVYRGNGFSSQVQFQNGYMIHLLYLLGINKFEIRATFETTIDIPESYYYK